MQDDHSQLAELSPLKADEIMEHAVLTEILVLHPTQLTILELAARMDRGEDFIGQDAVERAVRELARDGLVRCDCRRIWPSRAALRFDELLGGVL
ncbi:MAG TPA: hypothetical protein VFY04_04120 [Solirubrobacterales bacterium]|nr:hypothetical protein [Solirubrobacterales bacterium]